MNSDLRTVTIARDIAEEERNCQFYGCHAAMGFMMETGGNQWRTHRKILFPMQNGDGGPARTMENMPGVSGAAGRL